MAQEALSNGCQIPTAGGASLQHQSGNGLVTNGDNAATSAGDNVYGEKLPLHPGEQLLALANQWGVDIMEEKFCQLLNQQDDIAHLRQDVYYPKNEELPYADLNLVDGKQDSIYFCGNSLGLQPKPIAGLLQRELDKWAQWGVHGHKMGEMPWAHCDECVDHVMAKTIVGGKPQEVALMNGLTVNLHLLMVSFYRPTETRYKVLLEDHAFPSDHYVVESQLKLHNKNPEESMILLKPREGEHCLRTEDIVDFLEREGESIAVVLLSGVQYYTGQFFDIKTITKAGQAKGCYVGWDLAHAVGNVELHLHDWNVDFAAWCTYKYLNAGAGSIAGFYIHESHFDHLVTGPRLVGWWSHKMDTRFHMSNEIDLDFGAAGFRLSNPSPMLCASVEGSLKVFEKTSIQELRKKSFLLTGYLEYLLKTHFPKHEGKENKKPWVEIITPADPNQRGAQLSVKFSVPINRVFDELHKRGVVCDKREPDVLRLAPAPLYNNFTDVYRFVQHLEDSLHVVFKELN